MMRELRAEEVWAEFDAPAGQVSRAVTRCMVFACGVGLLVLLGLPWLLDASYDSGIDDEFFTAPQLAVGFTIALLPAMLAVYAVALVLLVVRPAEHLLSVVAAAVGLVSTVIVVLAGPDDIWMDGHKLSDSRWQAAPFVAMVLWLVALVLTARLRRIVRTS